MARRDNFAWFSGGGDNTVVRTSEQGFGILVITMRRAFLVAQLMDGPRLMDEELAGIDVEPVILRWCEEEKGDKARSLAGPGRIASDIPLAGTELMQKEIALLHYPLLPNEIERCRALGKKTEEIIAHVAASIRPGVREREIEAMFTCEYAREGMSCDVLLIGGDERIARYRHPLPTEKKVEKLVLLHPAARKWGLHANVTRMVSIGEPSDEIARTYDAANRVLAAAVSLSVPGQSFAGILERQKQAYRETGFPEEWRNHYQGGITGYVLADATLCNDPKATVTHDQAFDWFVTITGVKAEELVISTENGPEVISTCGKWPLREYSREGFTVKLPEILRI